MRKTLFTKLMLLTVAILGGVGSAWAGDTWVKTAPSSLTTGDIVVIVDQTSGTAMYNDNGTSSAPSATPVTLSSDKSKITGTVGETLQWVVTVSDGSYQFNVPNTSYYLYCTNSNNGVRVGTNENNAFTITTGGDNSADFLVHTATSRYIGVYNNQDWRCYTSINANIKTSVTAFYKKVSDGKTAIATIGDLDVTTLDFGAEGTFAPTITLAEGIGSEDYTVAWTEVSNDYITLLSDGTYQAGSTTGSTEVTVTVTPSEAKSSSFNAASKTFTLNIVDPNANDGSADKPYTVAEAIAYINTLSGTSADEVYVSGIISQVDSYNSNYSSITYWISDDGTTTGQMEVYSGKGLDGADFSSKDDLQVGDIVTVKGYVKMYNTTPEFDKNNVLVSFERPVVTTPSISLSTNSIEATAEGADGTITVTYNNLTDVVAEVQFFVEDGTTSATYDWITADINNDNNVEYLIDANDGAARTAYMKVYAVGNEGEATSDLITITQAKFVVTTNYTLATGIVSGKHYIIVGQKDGTYKAAGTQNSNNRAAVEVSLNEDVISVASSDVKEFVIYGPNAQGNYTIYDEDLGYLYAAQGTGTGNYLRTESKLDADGNGIWTISIDAEGVASVVATNPNITRNKIRYNSGSSCFSCYSSGQQNIYLYERDGEATPTETITVTDAKYATYCSENALDFSNTGLTAYIAKLDGTSVTFETVEKVPAYTGVLLKADAAGDFTVSATATVDDVTGNALIGVTKETKITTDPDNGIFVLMNTTEYGVGFYRTTGEEFTLTANTAYLPAQAAETSRSFIGFNFDTTTGINTMQNAQNMMQNNEVYNLNGQRVAAPQRGLYIVNGRKVVVK